MAVRELPRQSRIGMRVRMINPQRKLFQQLAIPVNLDDPPHTAFCDHQSAAGKRLKSVYLYFFAFVAVALGRIIGPHNLLLNRINFGNLCRSLLLPDSNHSHSAQIVNRKPIAVHLLLQHSKEII